MYQNFETMSEEMDHSAGQKLQTVGASISDHLRNLADSYFNEDVKDEAVEGTCKELDASNYRPSSSPTSAYSLDLIKSCKRTCEESPLPYLIRPCIQRTEDDGLDLYNEFIENVSEYEGSDGLSDEEDLKDYFILDRTDPSFSDLNEVGIFMSCKSKFGGMLAARLGFKGVSSNIDENLDGRNNEQKENMMEERSDQTESKETESWESGWELV